MHLLRGHKANAGVAVFFIVPIEEFSAKRSGVLDRAEFLRELGAIF